MSKATARAILDAVGSGEVDESELDYYWPLHARPEQRPPGGPWLTWLVLAGRGFGKTRTGAEWVRHRVEDCGKRRIALVAPTSADARDVMVEGESGLLSVCPPWNRPVYEPTKRRVVWPSGAMATTYSADEPERLRGPQHDDAWLDEVGAWRYPAAMDMLLFGLRLGDDPRVCVTTTPKPSKLIKDLIASPTTAKTGGSTYDNRANLAATFFETVIARYEGTPLGEQEIHAQVREITEGAWFPSFSVARHVTEAAEYKPGVPVRVAIDCGTSRHTGAVFFQVCEAGPHRHEVNVFGDYLAVDVFSRANAEAIRDAVTALCGGDRPERYRLDPASNQRTGVGPAVYGEYEQALGSRLVQKWPSRPVTDGLDMIAVMLGGPGKDPELTIHPRAAQTVEAFKNYRRKESHGVFLDAPVDPDHPYEDMIDALRGGLSDSFPDGRKPAPAFRPVNAYRIGR